MDNEKQRIAKDAHAGKDSLGSAADQPFGMHIPTAPKSSTEVNRSLLKKIVHGDFSILDLPEEEDKDLSKSIHAIKETGINYVPLINELGGPLKLLEIPKIESTPQIRKGAPGIKADAMQEPMMRGFDASGNGFLCFKYGDRVIAIYQEKGRWMHTDETEKDNSLEEITAAESELKVKEFLAKLRES